MAVAERPTLTRGGSLGFFLFLACVFVQAQGGPPLLTDDPGTPGNRQWEINFGATTEVRRDFKQFELPIADFNYGYGDRIQLKFEIPWLVRSSNQGVQTEAGDGKFGIKWRFADQEKHRFDVSMYPQLSWNSPGPQRLEERGRQLLIPFEVSMSIRRMELNWEAGYNIKQHGIDELTFGLAAAYQVTSGLELLGELHSVPLRTFHENESVFQLGGRKKLSSRYVLLFAAGSRLAGSTAHEPSFLGYVGLQLLLGKRTLGANAGSFEH